MFLTALIVDPFCNDVIYYQFIFVDAKSPPKTELLKPNF